MKRYTPDQVEALVNWDGMLCKPPFRNDAEKRQYFSRYVSRMLWRYLSPTDWNELAEIVDTLRVSDKLRNATRFLIARHTSKRTPRSDLLGT